MKHERDGEVAAEEGVGFAGWACSSVGRPCRFGGRRGGRETEMGGRETEGRDGEFLQAFPLVWVDVIFPVKSTGE